MALKDLRGPAGMKENNRENDNVTGSSMKRTSVTAKEVPRKYFKKVKPLHEKLSQKQQQKMGGHVHSIPPTSTANNAVSLSLKSERSMKDIDDVSSKDGRKGSSTGVFSHSFSGNLRPRRRSCASSCPSPMQSAPSHSGVLCKMLWVQLYGDTLSVEELQSAVQGAVAHCKNSMMQNKTVISDEI
ncbi:PREDICTED: probable membrane-associated kinase regulator 1 [Populus euphratica]|uniref:Probable membrane-associated kinase regulator 1 n=1 Tax=Populus euphratica TaxID=75702 RepID=A0AAJ6UFJ0_POPEU|nr:PREDICTED: probable membrane-associated kinase regulator 1 [Populus euphratica]